MARQPKITEIKFPVTKVDGINEDGRSRQDILSDLDLNDQKANILQYHRAELLENGHQVIEVMVNDMKVGEIDDADYILYQESIPNARGGRVAIYQEEYEDGTIHYTCDSYLIVPYINSETEKSNLRKRKQVIVVALCAVMLVFGIVNVFKGDFGPLVFVLVASFVLVYLAFIRDPKKDDSTYQFIKTGKKKKSI